MKTSGALAVLIAATAILALGPPALARDGGHGAPIRSGASLSTRATAVSAASASSSSGSVMSKGTSGRITSSGGGGGGGGSAATAPQAAPAAAPASQIGTPIPRRSVIAPLSPQVPLRSPLRQAPRAMPAARLAPARPHR